MPKTVSKNTEYRTILQRRDGKDVVVIEAVEWSHTKDGRGAAGSSVSDRQVMVVPLSSLSALMGEIAGTLIYQVSGSDDSFDLTVDHEPHIGLYVIDSPTASPLLVAEYHTLGEARVYSQAFAARRGAFLAKLPKDDGDTTSAESRFIENL